jgi:hypothetical protein
MRISIAATSACFIVSLLTISSCAFAPQSECHSDADCKGDRICTLGTCGAPDGGGAALPPATVTFLDARVTNVRTDGNLDVLGYDWTFKTHNVGAAGSFTIRLEGFAFPVNVPSPSCSYSDNTLGPFFVDADADVTVTGGFNTDGAYTGWGLTLFSTRTSGNGEEQTDSLSVDPRNVVDPCRNR